MPLTFFHLRIRSFKELQVPKSQHRHVLHSAPLGNWLLNDRDVLQGQCMAGRKGD